MFFTLAKFPFENMLNDNDNDEFIELLSLYYYKRNVLSCCLLILIIIILIIINYHYYYCYWVANLLQVPNNSNSEFLIIRHSMHEKKGC